MRLKTLKSLKKLKGKRVLLRLDLNVPLDAKGRILEGGEARIRAGVRTLRHLVMGGARVIIVSHLGRPRHRDPRYSLAPVARALGRHLGEPVRFVADSLEDEGKVEFALGKLLDGQCAMLENVRFYRGEDDNGKFLARRLAGFADAYVNDAFSVCHRKAASVSAVAKLLPAYAGLALEREIAALEKVTRRPKKPMVVMLGGAKVSDKIHVLERMAKLATTVLVGGAMGNAFLKAKGLPVGRSLVEPADVRLAKGLLRRHRNLVLPHDVLVSNSVTGKSGARIRAVQDVKKDEVIVDLGVATAREWAAQLKKAATLVWNGPLGLFEIKEFSHGSIALGRVFAARSGGKAFGVVGGGETVTCLERTGMAEYVDHVSTGGGAMLDFLAGKELPGLLPLMGK